MIQLKIATDMFTWWCPVDKINFK